MTKPFWQMSVLIPACNEERLLPRCLRSVMQARTLLPASVKCDVVVAADNSNDRTFEIAKRMIREHGIVLSTNAGIVGEARALAAQAALKRHRGPRNRCWLANTDADCIVPKTWLTDQLSMAAEGVEAVAGTIDVDTFKEHGPGVKNRFRASYLIHSDGSHPHIHGANIGVRADAYLRAGGWKSLATAEDHDLWLRLSAIGAEKVSVSQLTVLTSGRRVGRAPHGFAEALAAHNETAA